LGAASSVLAFPRPSLQLVDSSWNQRFSQLIDSKTLPSPDREAKTRPLAPLQVAVTEILAVHEKLPDTRSGRSAADPFVVALAQIEGCAVVTGERRRTRSADRPNIPDVCDALGIPCITLLDLMRAEGWKFER
jgi:hypothetical protein